MRVYIDIHAGRQRQPEQSDMQKNINALEKVAERPENAAERQLIRDTLTILQGIKERLPK